MAKSAGTVSARTVRSPEILALMRIEQLFDNLTPEQQARFLRYFSDRYVYAPTGTDGASERSAATPTERSETT